jgi:hypothetical protein
MEFMYPASNTTRSFALLDRHILELDGHGIVKVVGRAQVGERSAVFV